MNPDALGRVQRRPALQGTAREHFARAIRQRNLWVADETSLRELGHPTLEAALAYPDLLVEQEPEKLERACVGCHGRLETEATLLSLAESHLALAALAWCRVEPVPPPLVDQ